MAFKCVESEKAFRFVIPNGILPNSVDPLKIDQFNNYFPGQMKYFTPLSASSEGTLSSNVLSSFSYTQETQTIKFIVKEGLPFSDGTIISADDVAFAVARLLFARPDFPILKYIIGKGEWLKKKNPLRSYPSGIAVHGQEIEIRLSRNVLNPLFRFSMTVVSIAPKRCFDLDSNKVICQNIPGSGFYVELNRTKDSVSFSLSQFYKNRTDLPSEITFSYPKSSDLEQVVDTLKTNEVVFAYDLDISPDLFAKLKKEHSVARLGAAWFSGVVLNPRVKPFDDKMCRRLFLDTLYENFISQTLITVSPSKSIFTKIVPGYLEDSELSSNHLSASQRQTCCKKFVGMNFEWGIRKKTPSPLLEHALSKTATALGLSIQSPEVAPGSHTGWPSYKSKQIAMQTTDSGFWPLDPTSDIQMLFTPYLHEDYMDIWADSSFNEKINTLSKAIDVSTAESEMQNINRALYEQSLMGILSHQSYSYIALKKSNMGATQGALFLTVPYPWEVFNYEFKR